MLSSKIYYQITCFSYAPLSGPNYRVFRNFIILTHFLQKLINILYFLAQHSGYVFTRTEIVESVRGEGYIVSERAVDVHIHALRKKLGPKSEFVETVRGMGYKFS
ncbi:winged helix-turn-helix transcriptional regulator, partial [PVC group bacterium]|nr:winged helix-turn-helix transcriptional regulator [PVC group bacterium]